MKRILLAVGGLSPQIVTETVYALARRMPPFVPDEVHLVTTSEGAERARLQLLADPPGWFRRLIEEYELPPIRFDEQCIHVLRRADGGPLADIRTPEDNEAAADGIVEIVRRLTSKPDTALHVSIAGGRKTMGFFVGYALSLYGRPQDEMSHVLVSEPYESLREFFYPSKTERIIFTRDDRPVDAARAEVWLADIPFVRMREGVPDALKAGRASFSEVVRAASHRFDAPRLVLRVQTRTLETPLGQVRLPPVDFAFYWWLARLRMQGNEGIPCPALEERNADYARGFFDGFRILVDNGNRGHEKTWVTLREGMDKAYFEQRKTRTNKAIRLALGVNGSPYEIARIGRAGRFRFGLLHLPPESIRVEQT